MDHLVDLVLSLLNIPLAQALGALVVIGIAERMGFPVVDTFRALLRLEKGKKEDGTQSDGGDSTAFAAAKAAAETLLAEVRSALQPLLLEMNQLSQYANHDTTERLDKLIAIGEETLRGLERIHTTHREWEKYGINTRECDVAKKNA